MSTSGLGEYTADHIENSLEIMDQMTSHLQGAFQKLYRWIQRELKHLSLENPQINAGIRRALRVLAEKPTLFQYGFPFFFCTLYH